VADQHHWPIADLGDELGQQVGITGMVMRSSGGGDCP
jgi:hypothetical protein